MKKMAFLVALMLSVQMLPVSGGSDHFISRGPNDIQPLLWEDNIGVVQTPASNDAQVAEEKGDSNFGDSTSLYVQSASASSSYGNERTWLGFCTEDLLPTGAEPVYVGLRVYLYRSDDLGDADISCYGSNNVSWLEEEITWNDQPDHSATSLDTVTIPSGSQYRWFEFNVTDWAKGPADNLSFVLKSANEGSTPYRTIAFNSEEWDHREAPRLRFYFREGPEPSDTVDIFHFADPHSRLLPHDMVIPGEEEMRTVGGASSFTRRLTELKGSSDDSLVLLAGDIFEGGILGDMDRGNGTMRWLHLLDSRLETTGDRGIDAAVVGNHDIREGAFLERMRNDQHIDFISMNIYDRNTGTPFFQSYKIVNMTDSRVGILGYSTDDYSDFGGVYSSRLAMRECVWEDEDPTTVDVKDRVEHLRYDQGCDMVVLLMHSGHSKLEDLLEPDPDVAPPEVVIAGHWHTSCETAWQPDFLDYRTTLDESGPYLEFIAELNMDIKGSYVDSFKHPVKTDEVGTDPHMDSLMDELIFEYNDTRPDHYLEDVIGHTGTDLTLDKDRWWTVGEFPWYGDFTAGMWVADSMIYMAEEEGLPVDLAVQSGGGIRRDIASGPVTYREIYEAYPWTDDGMVIVERTGAEIERYLQEQTLSPAISAGWEVHADDGEITSILYNGFEISGEDTFNVAISEYMYSNEGWGISFDATSISIRDGLIQYTSLFRSENPLTINDTRYHLEECQWSGEFRAVVTMINDGGSASNYEDAFLRLISATPETVARIGNYAPAGLIRSDGTVNYDHQMSEVMWYRSHLGFCDGLLRKGDLVRVRVEGGFHEGNPQVIDQEGIKGHGREFDVIGHDPSLVYPEYVPSLDIILDDGSENHLFRSHGYRQSGSSIKDSQGNVYQLKGEDGYHEVLLPGVYGDLLEITGIITQEDSGRVFRTSDAIIETRGFPPFSKAITEASDEYTGSRVPLIIEAEDPDGSVESVDLFYLHSEDGLEWSGPFQAAGFDYGPHRTNFSFSMGPGHYRIYSIASDDRGNTEDVPFRYDIEILVDSIPDLEIDRNVDLGATEDRNYSLEIQLQDPKTDPLSYEMEIFTDAGWLDINGTSLNGTPRNDDVGDHNIRAVVSDGRTSDEVNWTLTVVNTNDPPVLRTAKILYVKQNENFSVRLNATDVDRGDILTWNLSTNASFVHINETTGTLNGTPSRKDVGNWTLNVSVTDNAGANTSSRITLRVIGSNTAPVARTDVSDYLEMREDRVFSISITDYFLEPDGDLLRFGSTGGPGINVTVVDNLTISFLPFVDWNGITWINMTVNDTEFSAYFNLTVNVTPVNDPPIIISMAVDGEGTEGTVTSLSADVRDPDQGDQLLLVWYSDLDGDLGEGSSLAVELTVGSHEITLNVSDGSGSFSTASRSFQIRKEDDAFDDDTDDDDIPPGGNGDDQTDDDDDDRQISWVSVLLIIGVVDILILIGIGLLIRFRNRKEEKKEKDDPMPGIDDPVTLKKMGARGSSSGFSSLNLLDPDEEYRGPPDGTSDEANEGPQPPVEREIPAQLENTDISDGEIPPGPHVEERKGPSPPSEDEIPPGPHLREIDDPEAISREDTSPRPRMKGTEDEPVFVDERSPDPRSGGDDGNSGETKITSSDEDPFEEDDERTIGEVDDMLDSLLDDSEVI